MVSAPPVRLRVRVLFALVISAALLLVVVAPLAVSDLVDSRGGRLGAEYRYRRLGGDLERLAARLEHCPAGVPPCECAGERPAALAACAADAAVGVVAFRAASPLRTSPLGAEAFIYAPGGLPAQSGWRVFGDLLGAARPRAGGWYQVTLLCCLA